MRVPNVAAQGTSCLTSNSWGISRRARYSLASLVFISSRISTEIATYPKPFLMPSNVSAPSDSRWWTEEQETGFPSAHFASCVDFTRFLQAMPPRHPPDADAWLVRLPSYRGLLTARTMCVLRWYRGCATKKQNKTKTKTNKKSSDFIIPSWKFLPGNLEVIFRPD